jgi:hypothetical protein
VGRSSLLFVDASSFLPDFSPTLDIFSCHSCTQKGVPVHKEWLGKVGLDSNHLQLSQHGISRKDREKQDAGVDERPMMTRYQ